MPDFFDDGVAEPEWLAQDTEEKKAKFGAFMQKIQNMPRYLNRINESLTALKTEYPSVEGWGSIGYCWGGKMVAVTSGENSPWKVGIQSSPAMVEPEDAKKVTVPMLVLASKDEPKDKIKAFGEELKGEKKVETFESSIHGWMSARADLEKEESKKEYERGYQVALEFLKKYL
ncbi:putative AIM2 family protein [Pseudocercospora fuligena]|uniref:Putative AIM2 family protein n=1 Tax=Pseudocercospora fuligena TaxID=685502 RepID=A0A8H6VP12_9PEZI|nr:putative AIM2 family protein [Pseudocercospora fuligena]